MPWFKVDDGFAHHYKISAAGNAAIGLWVRAGAWCMQNMTEGHVPTHVLRSLGTRTQAQRLVWAGLWDPDELDGYRFHDWHIYQPCREAVEYRRESEALKKQRQRAAGFRAADASRDAAGRFRRSRGLDGTIQEIDNSWNDEEGPSEQ